MCGRQQDEHECAGDVREDRDEPDGGESVGGGVQHSGDGGTHQL